MFTGSTQQGNSVDALLLWVSSHSGAPPSRHPLLHAGKLVARSSPSVSPSCAWNSVLFVREFASRVVGFRLSPSVLG